MDTEQGKVRSMPSRWKLRQILLDLSQLVVDGSSIVVEVRIPNLSPEYGAARPYASLP